MTTIEELEKMFKEHLEKEHKEISEDLQTLSDEQDWMDGKVDRMDERLKEIEDWLNEPADEEYMLSKKSLDELIERLEKADILNKE